FIIGDYQIGRLFNDDDFIATWGVSYPDLTDAQRGEMVELARHCRNQRDEHSEVIGRIYRNFDPHNRINRLIDSERALSSVHVQSILLSSSDPKYFFYALYPETGQKLSRVRFGRGADAARYARPLTDTHRQEYIRRTELLKEVVYEAGISAIA